MKTIKYILVLGMAAVAIAVLAAEDNDAVKKDLARLQGEWVMVSGSADGQPMPEEILKQMKRVCKGDEITVTMGDQLYLKAKITLDPSKKPKTIDYEMLDGFTKDRERDENGAWLASIPAIRGCHTHGRTLEQARSRLREALGLWIDRPDEAVIDETVRLPVNLKTAVERSRRTRERAERQRENAQEETRVAAEALVEEGVSLRDAGELLGLSHQRIQQLVSAR